MAENKSIFSGGWVSGHFVSLFGSRMRGKRGEEWHATKESCSSWSAP